MTFYYFSNFGFFYILGVAYMVRKCSVKTEYVKNDDI